jgi:polyribonucleotide nucleotidyltransferase
MKCGHAECIKLVDAQIELRRALGKADKVIVEEKPDPAKLAFLYEQRGTDLKQALLIADKMDRQSAVKEIKEDLLAKSMEKWPEEITSETFVRLFDEMEIDLVRKNILVDGKRIDGRDCETIRELYAQIGILPRAHGSAVFNRGETSALGTVTLGTKKDAQTLDAVTGGPTSKSFLLHYNFPPYCVGEVGRLGGLGRREIGHGNLAERSLAKVVPTDYPYSIRVVSDIMGSNGSSSMASICVGALAMMDAGIPISSPVAGVSVGLFTSADESQKLLVTDILGSEDHCGDMDFKVAGTFKGITGFQVDLKLRGLTWDVVEASLERAKQGRMQILKFMTTIIDKPRAELAEHAPRITTIKIPVDKIGALIGPGGSNIRRICEVTGAQIDIEEDGTVSVFATDGKSLSMAKREIESISAEAEEGKLYEGTVTGIKDFGCFVEIMPGKDGLCHISELADRRIGSVDEVCKVGDKMWVKCIAVDDRGRIKLSRREAMQELDAQKNED